MKKVDLKHIENIEGKYHLAFLEGKKMIAGANEDLRNALFSLLLFGALIAVFILISGFNLFYVYFLVAFLVVFIAMVVVFALQKRKGKKQCVFAVSHSKKTEIVNKSASMERASKVIASSVARDFEKNSTNKKIKKSMRENLDNFDKEEKKNI